MYTTIAALKKYLSAESTDQLSTNLQVSDTEQISMTQILMSNGIMDAQLSFPAFVGYEKIGLRYLVDCLKSIQPLLNDEKIKNIFESIEEFTEEKIDDAQEFAMLKTFLQEANDSSKINGKAYGDLIKASNNPTANIYKEIAIAESTQAIYCLVRWAIYSHSLYKNDLETHLYQLSFSSALQAAVNSIAYQKSAEVIQNSEVYRNVFNCCLNKQEKIFEHMLMTEQTISAWQTV